MKEMIHPAEYGLLTTEESAPESVDMQSEDEVPGDIMENIEKEEEKSSEIGSTKTKKRKKASNNKRTLHRFTGDSEDYMLPPSTIPRKKKKKASHKIDTKEEICDANEVQTCENGEDLQEGLNDTEILQATGKQKRSDNNKKFSLEALRRSTKNNPLLYEIASSSAEDMIAAAFKHIGDRNNLPVVEWCEAVLLYLCVLERLNLDSLTWSELCYRVESSHFNILTYMCTSKYRNSSETLLSYFETNRPYKEHECPSIGNKAFTCTPPVNYDALTKMQIPANNTCAADCFNQLPCVNK